MGTRSLTIFKDEHGKEIVNLYRQFDGYPDGHGEELASFLDGKRLINGIGSEDTSENAFNGMGCCSAAVVAHFKTEIGSFYLYAPYSSQEYVDYVYTVQPDQDVYQSLKLTCCGHNQTPVFSGSPAQFLAYLEEKKKEETE